MTKQGAPIPALDTEAAATNRTRRFVPAPVYDPGRVDRGIGVRGWLRLFQLGGMLVQFLWRQRAARRAANRTGERGAYRLLGAWLRDRFVRLGPAFIKLGQSLATRVDIVPVEMSVELQQLLDQVPPFPDQQAFAIIEAELGAPVSALFHSIEAGPIAAASIGQVYRARLPQGNDVVVKVQRPNLAELVNLDVAVLKFLLRLGTRIATLRRRPTAFGHKADWELVLDEFGSMMFEEMDYLQESVNAETFRENFRAWPQICVPRIHAELCARHVITLDYVDGMRVTDVDALKNAGLIPHEVHRVLAKSYLKQLLDDAFFHADPHPGNLRVLRDGRLAFFDFGMMGRIPSGVQTKLVDCFFHMADKDAIALIVDLIGLGFLDASGPDDPELQPLIRALVDHYLHLKLLETEVHTLASDLAEVMYNYPFRIPPKFAYILRTLMTLEAIGKELDPGTNFFDTARPFAKSYLLQREARELGGLLIRKMISRDAEKVDWQRTWKLAKMALKFYFSRPAQMKSASASGTRTAEKPLLRS